MDPEVTIIQKTHSESRKTTEVEVIIDNNGLEVSLAPQIEIHSIEDPQLCLSLLAGRQC